MLWHSPHHLSKLSHAIFATLLCSAGAISISQAATFGKTNVQSTQHEPLRASIAVSDIDAAKFSASTASASLYQQMGLSRDAAITVQFIPESASSGRIVLSTSQPISAPFTDVVLSVNDNGNQQVIPKTLLMPIADSASVATASQPIATTSAKPNLPEVSAANNTSPQPLQVNRSAPPPLLPSVNTSSKRPSNPATTAAPVQLATTQTIQPSTRSSAAKSATNNQSSTASQSLPLQPPPSIASSDNLSDQAQAQENNSFSVGDSNIQMDILSTTITRSIRPAGSDATASTPLVTSQPANPPSAQEVLEQANNASTPSPSATNTASNSASANSSQTTAQSGQTGSQSAVTYTVQRNDNLWSIANQLATQNDLSVQEVMSDIQNQNPDAFINGHAGLLKANAALALPNYDVVPSQQALQEAMQSQRAQQKKAAQSSTSSSAKSSNTQSRQQQPTKSQARSPSNNTTVKNTLPKPQMTLVTPTRQGKATGTQTDATAAAGNELNSELVSTLKSTRQQTANQAQKVNSLNEQMSAHTRTLKLQNQKLAELEARLKSLKNQN